VLDAGDAGVGNLYLYAFDRRGEPGGIVVLAINANPRRTIHLDLGASFKRYSLTAASLLSTKVRLNGKILKLGQGGKLPAIEGKVGNGAAVLAPQSISFFEMGRGVKQH
jgi:hypothetical protein